MENLFYSPAQLVVVQPGHGVNTILLNEDQITIGRTGGPNDVAVDSAIVSLQHGIITYIGETYYYIDLASTNGTYINAQKIYCDGHNPSAPVALSDGDVLTIGENNEYGRVAMIFSVTTKQNCQWKMMEMILGNHISIGRDTTNDIVISNVTVSRKHALIDVKNTGVTVTDLNSSNGTILNGIGLKGTGRFRNNSVLRIGNVKIFRVDNLLVFNLPELILTSGGNGEEVKNEAANQGGVQVVVKNISKIVPCKRSEGINGSDKKCILDDISLTINPGELVAILGGSGSGKTTFMNCINGFEPATSGEVLINGTDLYKNYQAIKSSIGYVPQQDIVYDNLTVKQMLKYSGKLRLPKDITGHELEQRVYDVMDMVDLTKQQDTYIKKLSGGQRKRASIAVELVSDPTLFFLDEPTSGLDPEAETNLMHRLRDLSKTKGKTVIVITHTLQNIHLFDKVIFIAPGGKLCFYGSPQRACEFFDIENLSDAYEKISDNIDKYVNDYRAISEGALA